MYQFPKMNAIIVYGKHIPITIMMSPFLLGHSGVTLGFLVSLCIPQYVTGNTHSKGNRNRKNHV